VSGGAVYDALTVVFSGNCLYLFQNGRKAYPYSGVLV